MIFEVLIGMLASFFSGYLGAMVMERVQARRIAGAFPEMDMDQLRDLRSRLANQTRHYVREGMGTYAVSQRRKLLYVDKVLASRGARG